MLYQTAMLKQIREQTHREHLIYPHKQDKIALAFSSLRGYFYSMSDSITVDFKAMKQNGDKVAGCPILDSRLLHSRVGFLFS